MTFQKSAIKVKRLSIYSPREMIAKLEMTLSNAQQNKDQTFNPNKTNWGSNKQCINNNSSTTALERPAEVTGGFNKFYCQIFALDSAVTSLTRKKLSFLTYMFPMYHHWETIKINIL